MVSQQSLQRGLFTNSSGIDFQLEVMATSTDRGQSTAITTDTINVNLAPISSNPNLLVMGNEARTLTEADFGFTDADSITHVKIIPQGSNLDKVTFLGELTLNVDGLKADVSINQEITVADINDGKLIYTPYQDVAAKALDALQFQLYNGNMFSDNYTMTIDVAEVGTDLDDNLYGSGSSDIFYGGKGDDALTGNTGDDELHGGKGDDELHGGKGDDILNGGAGTDLLTGDGLGVNPSGADVFQFTSADVVIDLSSVEKADTITDFLSTQGDTIELEGFGLLPLSEDVNYFETSWQGADVNALDTAIKDGSIESQIDVSENQSYITFLTFTDDSITYGEENHYYLLYDNDDDGMYAIAKLDGISGQDAIDVTDFSIV